MSRWPRTDLLDLLGIEHPILQAPMAGVTTPALAAAASNAGALGAFGWGGVPEAVCRKQFAAARDLTNKAINVNFFVHEEPAPFDVAPVRARFEKIYAETGVSAPSKIQAAFGAFDENALAMVLELRPQVVSFHFGLPEPDAMARLKGAGIIIMSSATNRAEAIWLEQAGADAIVAQGNDAGGHRGIMKPPFSNGCVGTFSLTPAVVDAVTVPVIAAGGVSDARGIAAAFALGASGVQVGTAFLLADEAGTSPAHRAAIEKADGADTTITTHFSGRPARSIRNKMTDLEVNSPDEIAPFPTQLSVAAPLRQHSVEKGTGDFIPLWAGQAVGLCRSGPVAQLVEGLVDEALEIMGH